MAQRNSTTGAFRSEVRARLLSDVEAFMGVGGTAVEIAPDVLTLSLYMEKRFRLLECVSKLNSLLNRELSLRELERIALFGALPMATRASDGASTVRLVERGRSVFDLFKILKAVGPLFNNIVRDDPRRLNCSAYRAILAAFRGEILQRVVRMEKIIYRMTVEKHLEGPNQEACPGVVGWLAESAYDLLTTRSDKLGLSDTLRLNAAVEVAGQWTRLNQNPEHGFRIHFTLLPRLLQKPEISSRLNQGVIELESREIPELCAEIFEEIMILTSQVRGSQTRSPRALQSMIRTVQTRVYKAFKSSDQRQSVGSIAQFRRDLHLIPPCIRVLVDRLERDGRLTNYDRYILLVFLRKAGLPETDAENFLREVYNRNRAVSDQWTPARSKHFRRVYRNTKRNQLRCDKFDRFCVWRGRSEDDVRRTLVKIRNGQQSRPEERCSSTSVSDFRGLLQSVGKATNADEARLNCARLGCFEGSDIAFFSPLGYLYNTVAAARQGNSESASEGSQPGPSSLR